MQADKLQQSLWTGFYDFAVAVKMAGQGMIHRGMATSSRMADVYLACQLWDLADDALDQVLDLAQGQWGVSGLSIGCVVPPINALRANPNAEPRVIRTAGGWCFPTNPDLYAATRAKPRTCDLFRGRDPLRRVVDACRERDLQVRLEVWASTAAAVTAKYPDAACKDLFGHLVPDRICLVNTDSQELIVATCRDLVEQYVPDAVVLHDLWPGSAGPSDLHFPFSVGDAGRALLALCFCETCLRLAHGPSDGQAARRAALARMDRILHSGQPDDSPLLSLYNDEVLGGFIAAQWQTAAGLVRSIRSAISAPPIVTIDAALAGHSQVTEHLSQMDRVCVSAAEMHAEEAESAARIALALSPAARQAGVQLPAYPHDGCCAPAPESALLVRVLSRLFEMGVAAVTLQEYGHIPAEAYAGVRQAVRFSRRKSLGPQPPASV